MNVKMFFLTLFMATALHAVSQKQGQELLDSSLRALPFAKEDTQKVKLLLSISQLYISTNTRQGFGYAYNGLALAQKLGWKRGIADLNNSLGLLTGDTGNNAGSRVYFEKSLAINKELHAAPLMINNMNNIGRSYQRESNFGKASEFYFKGLALAEAAGNDEQAAVLGTNITALYIIQKDYQKAAQYAVITIKKGTAANALIHVAKAYELLGVMDLENNDTLSGKKKLEKALAIDQKLGNEMAVAAVLINLGTADPDPEKQIAVFLRVQQILDKIAPSSPTSVANLINLGLNYYTLGIMKTEAAKKLDFDSAEAYLNRAVALCISTHLPEYEADTKNIMANLQEAKGNYKAALQNYKEFTLINDSIFSQENKNKIAALESQRFIDLKNKEIENKELQIGNQQKRMWLLISLIVFLLTTGLLIYRQSQLQKKTNTTLLMLNNELDEANKVKAKFFGILSHDLRSPVANLINFLQLQKRRPGIMTEQQVTERENKIAGSASSLLDTMEAMLLWSKGQMEHFKPDVSSIRVSELFAYLQKFFTGTENVSFNFSGEDNLLVQTDENYLQTIMHNLTANAVKAVQQTPQAQVSWKAWEENNHVYLSITDNGPGASEENLKALYDETTSSGAKHGLGLHIIRDLAKAIGCSVALQPRAESGTTFILCI